MQLSTKLDVEQILSDKNAFPGANIDAGISTRSTLTQADILSDTTPFAGANIDGKISNAGVDPAIVRREAETQGWAAAPIRHQPGEISTSVSGGGSVVFGEFGMNMTPGTTSGDTAKAFSTNVSYMATLDMVKFVITYEPSTGTPFGDDVELGGMSNLVNSGIGGFLDLTGGNYHAGTNTAAATLPGQDEVAVLIIEIDYAAGETRFEQRGAVNESVTIEAADTPSTGRALANSNGAGDELHIYNIRELTIGSK